MLQGLRTLLLLTLLLALPLKGMAAVGFMACAPLSTPPSAPPVAIAVEAPAPCHGEHSQTMAPQDSDASAPELAASGKPGCQTCAPCCTPAMPAPWPLLPTAPREQAAPVAALPTGATDAPHPALDRPPRDAR